MTGYIVALLFIGLLAARERRVRRVRSLENLGRLAGVQREPGECLAAYEARVGRRWGTFLNPGGRA